MKKHDLLCGAIALLAMGTLAVGSAIGAEPGLETLICHRGESVDAPENTLPAYRLAVERGFGFECDVYLSKDGRCFTFHDGNLKRTTGGANTNRCRDVTWDELSKIDVGNWGKWKGSRFAGTRPALLEEVLELARNGRWIYIEIKAGPEIVPYVRRILEGQKNATPGNVLFICFNSKVCAELKRQLPDYKVYWLSDARHDGKKSPVTPQEIISACRACGADGVDISFDQSIHTAEFVAEIRKAGLEFHVWTVDQTVRTLLAFCRGVQTVTTNCAKYQLDECRGGKKAPKRTTRFENPYDLNRKDCRIAVMANCDSENISRNIFNKADIVTFGSMRDAVWQLLAGKVDGFVFDEHVLRLLQWKYPDRFRVLEDPIDTDPSVIAVSARHPELLGKLNNFIAETKKSGLYDEMFLRWCHDPERRPEDFPEISEVVCNDPNAKVLRVGIDPIQEPNAYFDKEGKLCGYDIEYILRFGRKEKCRIEFVENEEREILSMLSRGELDVVIANLGKEPKIANVLWTDGYLDSDIKMMVRDK